MAEGNDEPPMVQRTISNEGSVQNTQGFFKFSNGERPKGMMNFSNSPQGSFKFSTDSPTESPTTRSPLTPSAPPLNEDENTTNTSGGGQAEAGSVADPSDDGPHHKHHEHFHGYHSERQYRDARSHEVHHHHHDHGHHHEGHHHAHGSRRH